MKELKSWYMDPVIGAISDCQALPVIQLRTTDTRIVSPLLN